MTEQLYRRRAGEPVQVWRVGDGEPPEWVRNGFGGYPDWLARSRGVVVEDFGLIKRPYFEQHYEPLPAPAPDAREALEIAREALEQAAVWLRGGDYDTRGGMIEMSRLASVCETALARIGGGA